MDSTFFTGHLTGGTAKSGFASPAPSKMPRIRAHSALFASHRVASPARRFGDFFSSWRAPEASELPRKARAIGGHEAKPSSPQLRRTHGAHHVAHRPRTRSPRRIPLAPRRDQPPKDPSRARLLLAVHLLQRGAPALQGLLSAPHVGLPAHRSLPGSRRVPRRWPPFPHQ